MADRDTAITTPTRDRDRDRDRMSLDGTDDGGDDNDDVRSKRQKANNKPKQKRNKPTLSCEECVERKTKVRQCSCPGPPLPETWPPPSPPSPQYRLSQTVSTDCAHVVLAVDGSGVRLRDEDTID